MLYSAKTPPGIATLIILTGLSTLTLNMFLPSLSNMALDFEVDYALVTLSIAGYLGVTAVLMMVMGPLSDRFGRRPVILLALIIFTLASLVCALSSNIWVFLIARVFQGVIISGWALSFATIRDMVPPQEAASKIGYVTMAMAVAPMLGPMFGGLLDELFNWRASFLAFMVFGLLAFLLCWVDMGETNKSRSVSFMRQLRTYPELLRSGQFWSYGVCTMFSTGSFYAFLAGIPLVALTLLGLSPGMLGFYMGTITAGFAFGSFLSGRYSKRYTLNTMMISGRIVACAGLIVGLTFFLAGYLNVFSLFGAVVFVGVGNGLTMPSSNAGALSVQPRLAGSASGLSGALTVGGGAILTSVTGIVVTEENGAYALLGMMLLCAALSLLAALNVQRAGNR
jgi:Bcr/CflA subfamily drug resistance transporter